MDREQRRPRVSVIIPTHNRPQALERALRSVLTQTLQPEEVIVVENGASEGAEAVSDCLRAEGLPVTYLYQPRGHIAAARNAGARLAEGEYLAFLDDDDVWLPEKLERQLEYMVQHGHTALVTCGALLVDSAGQVIGERRPVKELTFETLIDNGCLVYSMSSVVVRRACLLAVGGFSEVFQTGEDYDLYLRLAQRYELAALPDCLFRYTKHTGNISRNFQLARTGAIQVLLHYRDAGALKRPAIRKRIASEYLGMADDFADDEAWRDAARYYGLALLTDLCAGVRQHWGRVNSPLYRFARPYAALLRSAWRSIR